MWTRQSRSRLGTRRMYSSAPWSRHARVSGSFERHSGLGPVANVTAAAARDAPIATPSARPNTSRLIQSIQEAEPDGAASAATASRPTARRDRNVLSPRESSETRAIGRHVPVRPVAVRLAAPRRVPLAVVRGSSGSRCARSRSAARCRSGRISQSVRRSDAASCSGLRGSRRHSCRRARSRSRVQLSPTVWRQIVVSGTSW